MNEKDEGGEYYRRWLQGDEDAFGQIITLYRKNLIFYVNQTLKDPALSEEVAIDTFAELILHKHRYNYNSSLKTYLYTIAKNKALNVLRARKRIVEFVEEEHSDFVSLEQSVLNTEQKKELYAAIEALPKQQAQAIYLFYFEDLSYAECAKVMNVNKKKIDNLLTAAKAALAKKLKGTDLGVKDENR